MSTEAIITTAIGFLSMLLYGYFFAGREAQVRQWLSGKRHGFLRWRYVRACVGAMRGDAKVADSSMILHLVFLMSLMFAMIVGWYVSLSLQIQLAEGEATITRLEVQQVQSVQFAQKHSQSQKEKEWADKLSKQIEESTLNERPIKHSERLTTWPFDALSWLIQGYAGFMGFFWAPYAYIRKRFSTELDRFNLRIQGLASKAELAELAAAEIAVRDEATLKEFVLRAFKIAQRHDVPQLVRTFNLWPQEITSQ